MPSQIKGSLWLKTAKILLPVVIGIVISVAVMLGILFVFGDEFP